MLSIPIPKPEDLPSPSPSPPGSPSAKYVESLKEPQARTASKESSPNPASASGSSKLQACSAANALLIKERQVIFEKVRDIQKLPELDYKPSGKYVESTKESVLHPLIKRANCLIVAGGFFGDEGKGKTVDAIAIHPLVKMVARVNSGENAGHTVFGPTGIKYAFNLCPSGILTPGKVNAIGPECVMDPVSFMEREIKQLSSTGVAYKETLYIGNVHLVCPHHKLLDLMGSWKAPNMSTIQGMAPVHGSKAMRKGLRMDHLFCDRAEARKRLDADLFTYFAALKNLGITEKELAKAAAANPKIQKHVLEFVEAPDKATYLFDLYDKVVVNNPDFPQRADVSHMLRETVKNGGKVLLEGPQSYWLSNAAEKYWEVGTSANTCASGMLAASRLNLTGLRTLVINIHKTPGSSRVGGGANPVAFLPQMHFSQIDAVKDDFMTMELDWKHVSKTFFDAVQPNGIMEPGSYSNGTGTYDLGVAMACASCVEPSHGEFGVVSGRPRVVGFFDCVAHAEVMAAQGPYCSISAFDRGDVYEEYGICIAYVFQHPEGKSLSSNGRIFESGMIIKAGEQLPMQPVLEHCHPIIKKVRGWPETPIFARSDWWKGRKAPVALPEAVCEMLDIIEHFTGTRVISIGNGPKGEDIIYITRQVSGKDQGTTKGKAKEKAKAKATSSEREERRLDPDDGEKYTLEELLTFYRGKFKKKAIEAYWNDVCIKPRRRPQRSKREQ